MTNERRPEINLGETCRSGQKIPVRVDRPLRLDTSAMTYKIIGCWLVREDGLPIRPLNQKNHNQT